MVDQPADPDEVWTTRDGREIAVGDMEEQHVRNVLRMILRKRRERRERQAEDPQLEPTIGEAQEMLNAQYYMDLANPEAYFPMLGCYGSPELQARYRR